MENLMIIHRTKLGQLFNDLDGKFGTAVFTKKDFTERTMNFRMGVKKGLKGSSRVPNERYGTSLITAYDMKLKAYRTINLATVKAVYANGTSYQVTG